MVEGPHLRVLFPPGHQHLCRGYSGRKFRLEAKLASFSVLVAAGTGDREAEGWVGRGGSIMSFFCSHFYLIDEVDPAF